jgi:hypothetical protein
MSHNLCLSAFEIKKVCHWLSDGIACQMTQPVNDDDRDGDDDYRYDDNENQRS